MCQEKKEEGTGGFGRRRTSGDHPKYSIAENGQNTGNSHEELRRIAVTQTPANTDVENSKGVKNKEYIR